MDRLEIGGAALACDPAAYRMNKHEEDAMRNHTATNEAARDLRVREMPRT